MHPQHKAILASIRKHSGKPTQHTFLDSYLGNNHPRYPINVPTLRMIARAWMIPPAAGKRRDMSAGEFCEILSSLIKGKSSTEKCMAGLLLDVSLPSQRKFDPEVFAGWLDHLEGWVEIDTLCTGQFATSEIPGQWKKWKPLLNQLSKSKNINKRRASLVLLCSPLRKREDKSLVGQALATIDRLKAEREIIITKAISWVLRSASIHHKDLVKKYLALNEDTLPNIAVRETMTKLRTGRKTKPKS